MFGYGFDNRIGRFWRGGPGLGMRRGFVAGVMLNGNITGLDYAILSIVSDSKLDASGIYGEISKFKGNRTSPVLGCINIHLKDLVNAGYLRMSQEVGKSYYELTDKGKDVLEGTPQWRL